jgi:hypothetical protein
MSYRTDDRFMLRDLFREDRKLRQGATTGKPIQKAEQNSGSPTAPTMIEEQSS